MCECNDPELLADKNLGIELNAHDSNEKVVEYLEKVLKESIVHPLLALALKCLLSFVELKMLLLCGKH
jgi:hypothetical protein